MKKILVFLVIFLSSCAKPFQPVAPGYTFWSKPDAGELEVKKAMLECGKPSPDPTVQMYNFAYDLKDDDEQLNHYIMTNRCMESAGYTDRHTTAEKSCLKYPERTLLPACQPNAIIPTPSVERRLNSWYCKIKTDYQYCLKHAVNPPACNPDGYENPPPECLR